MKKLVIIPFFLLCIHIIAQENPPQKEISKIGQREDKLILNFTSDNWAKLSSLINSKPLRSRGFSFLLMNEKMNKTGNAGIGLGLGFMSQNVHTDAFITDTSAVNSAAVLQKFPANYKFKTNKVSLNFITAAIELRFRTNANKDGKRFKCSVGMIAGLLVQSHTKYEDDSGKFKLYNIRHLNKFQYGAEGRIGYDNFALYGYYSLVNVFKDGQGPELIPYSLGIAFAF